MALTQFDGQNKAELSMIEVARAILSDRHDTMAFNDLLNEVQSFTGKSDEEIRARLAQFYTDLNIDGSFISLGDNMWGLRSWYPIDSIDEAVHLQMMTMLSTTTMMILKTTTSVKLKTKTRRQLLIQMMMMQMTTMMTIHQMISVMTKLLVVSAKKSVALHQSMMTTVQVTSSDN